MSKKKHKRVTRVTPPAATTLVEPLAGAAPDRATASTVSGGVATDVEQLTPAQRRRVARVNQRRSRVLTQPTEFAPLDPDDAAIPFERVPYVPGDLRRVAIIAALMVALIIVATVVVPRLVGG